MKDFEATFAKRMGKVIEKHYVDTVSATSFADAENTYETLQKQLFEEAEFSFTNPYKTCRL